MDLLFSRYASPFLLVETMIDNGRFYDFVCELLDIRNEEMNWEYFLHKVFDKSFKEFTKDQEKHSNSNKKQTQKASQSDLEATIKQTKEIAKMFRNQTSPK